MTDEQLAALAEAATPARWIAEQGMGVRLADYTPICMSWNETCEPVNVEANMAFIAAARQAVPELLAEVSGLRRQLAEMTARRDDYRARFRDLERELEIERQQLIAMQLRAEAAEAER